MSGLYIYEFLVFRYKNFSLCLKKIKFWKVISKENSLYGNWFTTVSMLQINRFCASRILESYSVPKIRKWQNHKPVLLSLNEVIT